MDLLHRCCGAMGSFTLKLRVMGQPKLVFQCRRRCFGNAGARISELGWYTTMRFCAFVRQKC